MERDKKNSPVFVRPRPPRGLALIMVMLALAAVSLMSYAVLSSGSVRARVAGNDVRIIQARYLAESGLNLAAYYVEHPDRSPVPLVQGASGDWHYGGETSVTLDGLPGTLATLVTNPEVRTFKIVATGTLDGYDRSATATYRAVRRLPADHAVYLRGDVLLPAGVTVFAGGVVDAGTLALADPGRIVGEVLAANVATPDGQAVPTDNEAALGIVRASDITLNSTLPSYTYNGVTCTAKRVSADVVNTVMLDLDTVNNPANVWYADANRTFTGPVTLDGTLVVMSGKSITVNGAVTITPESGMPGLVVDKNVIFDSNNTTLRVNGLMHVGNKITGDPTLSLNDRLVVNGALYLEKSNSPIDDGNYRGTIEVTLNPQNVKVSNYAPNVEKITGLQIVSWNVSGVE